MSTPGARIAGVPVAGLTPAQARQRLARELGPKLDRTVRLTDGVKTLALPRRQLGVGLDMERMLAQSRAGALAVPLRLKVDRAALQRTLRKAAPRFAFAGRNARPYEHRGVVKILPGLASRRANVPLSAQRIAAQIERNPALQTASVSLVKQPPRVSTENLKGITGRLSRFITRYNLGQVKRTRNMRVAIRSIHGTILPPGEVFSLNGTVGERTQARGYRTAIIFKDRKMAYDIGGGVSQVTGTLFNAALMAGLKVEEYRTHTQPVQYLPLGRDATVSWGDFDMKFRNTTPAPIYIDYRIVGNRVVATLYGRKTPGMAVKLAVVPRKLGPRHLRARLYRTIKVRGNLVKKELVGRSEYLWKPGKLG